MRLCLPWRLSGREPWPFLLRGFVGEGGASLDGADQKLQHLSRGQPRLCEAAKDVT